MKAKPAVATLPRRKKPVAGRGRVALAVHCQLLNRDWRILPVAPAELRAACVWEYARESMNLVALVDRVAAGGAGFDAEQWEAGGFGELKTPALEEVRFHNETLAGLVRVAGARADLRKPWNSLPAGLRGRMAEALDLPARVASFGETKIAVESKELFRPGMGRGAFGIKAATLQALNPRNGEAFLYGAENPAGVVAFAVDFSKSPEQIGRELAGLLRRELPPVLREGFIVRRGRAGNGGADICRKALRDLGILRLASCRTNGEIAAGVASGRIDLGALAGELGAGEPPGPELVRKCKAESLRVFAIMFPALTAERIAGRGGCGMISGDAFGVARKRGRPRGRRF